MHSPWFRPGGVHQDVPGKKELLVDIGDWARQPFFPNCSKTAMSLVVDNRIFKQRNVHIAVVGRDDAVGVGL